MVSRITMSRSRGFARGAAVAAGSALLLGACVPDQQATGNRPVIQADEDDLGALMRVAAMTRQSGDIDTAIALYRRAHERDPDDPRPLIEIARMLEMRGATADAALVWQEAGRVAPGNAEVLGGYGITLARLGQAQLAQTYLQQAAQKGPTAQIWNALGVVRDRLGDAAGAQTAYRAGLALAPDDTRLANNLALSLALSGQAGEAAALLERVVQRPDAQVRHRQNLALVYALAGRDEDAERMGALDADPADAQRNVMRHASIAALPDHASRVAAVSTVQNASPVRRNEAKASVAAAALIRDGHDSVPMDNIAAATDEARVTPLVTLTAVGDSQPQPRTPAEPAAVAQVVAAASPAPTPTVAPAPAPAAAPKLAASPASSPAADDRPAAASEPAREERETLAVKAPAQTEPADVPPADAPAADMAHAATPDTVVAAPVAAGPTEAGPDRAAEQPMAAVAATAEDDEPQNSQPALVAAVTPAAPAEAEPERAAEQPMAALAATAEDDEPQFSQPPLVAAMTPAAPVEAEPVDDSAAATGAAGAGTDTAAGLTEADTRPADPAASIADADADAGATPSVAQLVMQAVDAADSGTDESAMPAEADENVVDATAGEPVTDPGEPALAPALAGVSVPSVEDQLIVAASAYHAEAYDFAAEVWQRLADAGDARAQFHLGALYYEGRGVDKDPGKAYVLLRQSEHQGFADARIVLALVEAKLSDTERREAEKQVAAAPR